MFSATGQGPDGASLVVQMSPVKIDCAKRQLFSLSKSQNIKLQEAASKKKKASSPAADPQPAGAAETAPAEAAAEAADDPASAPAEAVKPEGRSIEKKRKKKFDRQEDANGQASSEAAKARPIKRKRKDAADDKVQKPCSVFESSSSLCQF